MQLAKKKNRTILHAAAELERMCEREESAAVTRFDKFCEQGDSVTPNDLDEARAQWVKTSNKGVITWKKDCDRDLHPSWRTKYFTCSYCLGEFFPANYEYVRHASVSRHGSPLSSDAVFPACSDLCLRYLSRKANRLNKLLEAEWTAIRRAQGLLSQARRLVKEKLHPSPLQSQKAELERQTTLHA